MHATPQSSSAKKVPQPIGITIPLSQVTPTKMEIIQYVHGTLTGNRLVVFNTWARLNPGPSSESIQAQRMFKDVNKLTTPEDHKREWDQAQALAKARALF